MTNLFSDETYNVERLSNPSVWQFICFLVWFSSRHATVMSWQNQSRVTVSSLPQGAGLSGLMCTSGIKVKCTKSSDLLETLCGHMHYVGRAVGTKSPAWLNLLEREDSSIVRRYTLGRRSPLQLLLYLSRAVRRTCFWHPPPGAVSVWRCILVAFGGLMQVGLESVN